MSHNSKYYAKKIDKKSTANTKKIDVLFKQAILKDQPDPNPLLDDDVPLDRSKRSETELRETVTLQCDPSSSSEDESECSGTYQDVLVPDARLCTSCNLKLFECMSVI